MLAFDKIDFVKWEKFQHFIKLMFVGTDYIHHWNCSCILFHQACVLQRQRKGSVSSDASASTDSNTYYEDDFSSTEEDSSQGICIALYFNNCIKSKLEIDRSTYIADPTFKKKGSCMWLLSGHHMEKGNNAHVLHNILRKHTVVYELLIFINQEMEVRKGIFF